MIHDLMLRWVVTGLFVLTAAECGLAIIAKRRPWTLIVNHGLHFAMAVAMAVMAWPWGARVPTTGPAVFFLLAAVWFGATAVVAVTRYSAAAAVFWACRFVMERRQEATQSRLPGSIGQAMMAAGMAMLFFAMLFPV